jgi:hypothetical protein
VADLTGWVVTVLSETTGQANALGLCQILLRDYVAEYMTA